jgi:hypothetical protein
MADQIIVNLPGQTPVEVSPQTPLQVTIGQPDEALALHSLLQGPGGHIPAGGLTLSDISGWGTAALLDQADIATATQGLLAESALQPGGVTIADIQGLAEFIGTQTERYVFRLHDLSSLSFYYYGGDRLSDGKWKVNRIAKDSLEKWTAVSTANLGYETLAEAWAARSSLVYGVN